MDPRNDENRMDGPRVSPVSDPLRLDFVVNTKEGVKTEELEYVQAH